MSEPSIERDRDHEGRRTPLSVKLGALVLVLVGAAGSVVSVEMATRERQSLVEGKRRSAERAVELYAAYTAAALEFSDAEAARGDAAALLRSPDVQSVSTYDAAGAPLAAAGAADPRGFPGLVDTGEFESGALVVVRRIRGQDGAVLGVTRAVLSLAREDRAYAAARTRIVAAVAAGAVLLVLALTTALRSLVTRPLARLVEATVRVRRGERVAYATTSRDEVGALGRAFDRMATTIVEREASLRDAKQRMQNVLDHMGQAILVFDARGALDPERSHEAEVLLRDTPRSIVDALFPEGSRGFVEREAFEAWMGAVFGEPRATFEELADLAPAEASVDTDRGARTYTLAFRPVGDGELVERVMLVATDVTDQRTLRATALRKEIEHEKRVASMRRLVAGGGQVFVRFLDGARYRLTTSKERLAEVTDGDRVPVGEVFRHVHTLRGEARCFDLDAVEEILAGVEFDLSDLRVRTDDRYDVRGKVAEIVSRLDACRVEVDQAEALFVEHSPIGAGILDQVTVRRSDVDALVQLASARGDEVATVARRLASRPFGETVFVVSESVPRWLERAQKEALLVVEGRDVAVPPELSRVLPGVLAHLVRNAVAHGLEPPDERARLGKAPRGMLTLGAEESAGGAVVYVADDGRGFDLGALTARGKGDARSLDEALVPFVSTRAQADELAGHGVGIDAVRDELRSVGYRISIESTTGRGARVLLAPAPSTHEAP